MGVIIMTAYGEVETAVTAMKEGAFDYLLKPFEPEDLDTVIHRILEFQQLRDTKHARGKRERDIRQFEQIIGNSPQLQRVRELIGQVAPTDATVLIWGESGTGKELVARALHHRSDRRDGPFITVSCGGLPETLLESELFGHEKGAFTGAIKRKLGMFELADGGTLFLDEIGEMSLKTQVNLLRVLQEREFMRVGGTELIHTDVRIVAATNRDLRRAITEGRFREDLYYRIHVVPITLPVLRDRREDIPALVHHFIAQHNERGGRHILGVADEAMQALMAFDWPGNVRELENAIEYTVVLKREGQIELMDLPNRVIEHYEHHTLEESTGGELESGFRLQDKVARYEKYLIVQALRESQFSKKRAAARLGISPRIMSYYLKKYSISEEEI